MRPPYTKTAIVILFINLFFSLAAQPLEKDFDWPELIYSENHFSLIFIYGRSPKAIINPDPQQYKIGTSSYESLEGGIDYHYSINKYFSIITGLRGGGIMRDLRYFIPGTEFTPPLGYDIESFKIFDKSGVEFFRIPFFVEERFFGKTKGFWNAQAGISLLFSFSNELINESMVQTANNQNITYLYGIFSPNNQQKPWFNYHAGVGYNKILKNKDLLRLSLVFELSKTQFFRGITGYKCRVSQRSVLITV